MDLASHRIELVADALEMAIEHRPDAQPATCSSPRTGAGKVLRIVPTGQQEILASGLLSPIGLALSRERVLTAEPAGGRVLALRYRRRAYRPSRAISGGRAVLAVDARGQLFVAEVDAGRLLRIGNDGSTEVIASGLALDAGRAPPCRCPSASRTDAEGGVLVASPGERVGGPLCRALNESSGRVAARIRTIVE
jgi:sugar lactone lactonase YvrE